ncbi:hypothetical protein H0E87_002485 [Populus deltoides]|uniref:Uncharacterized protein n=1 Tax=Populus deltoides TaxID=3696 RepID=A0A8T2ZVY0_POPDE|nr:hypothetical protein H0E87_002485 [Populus deltoides]
MPVPLAPYPTPPAPYAPPAPAPAPPPPPPANVTLPVQLYINRHRNGPVGLRRLPHLTDVHPWSNERAVFLLSYSQSSLGGKSSGTRQLWELQDAVDVPIWSTVCEMCCLQFCHTSWGQYITPLLFYLLLV